MNSPLVSVIVPVYNTSSFLSECIDSILRQSYNNIEIILIDDGSTDESSIICDHYSSLYTHIKVLHKPNGGLSSARNAGIKIAKGKYYTFVDSDDIISYEMINDMVNLAIAENADMVITILKKVFPGQKCVSSDGDYRIIPSHQALLDIYDYSKPKIISSCGKLFSANLFGNIRFPEGLYYEDEFTTPKLFYYSDKIVLSKKELYFYMQRTNDSIMRGEITPKKILDSLHVGRERIDFFKEIKNNRLIHLAKTDYYYKLLNAQRQSSFSVELSDIHSAITRELVSYKKENRLLTIVIKLKLTIHELLTKVKGN